VTQTRTIKAKDFVRDIRAGRTETDLIKKYGVPRETVQDIFRKLVDSGLIRPSELPSAASPPRVRYDEVELSAIRASPRYSLGQIELVASDPENPSVTGIVRDISEGGLGIAGVKREVGEWQSFVLVGRREYLPQPIALDCECRWVQTDKSSGRSTGGYEITVIAEDDLARFQALIGVVREQRAGA
jgi:hypothetical protein